MDIEKLIEKQQDKDAKCINKFEKYLLSNISKKTANKHLSNIELYTHYHNYYAYDKDDISKLSDMDAYSVTDFLDSWVLRKTYPTSLYQLDSYIGSFKKFHKWLVDQGETTEEDHQKFVSDLKKEKPSIDKKWFKFLVSNREYLM